MPADSNACGLGRVEAQLTKPLEATFNRLADPIFRCASLIWSVYNTDRLLRDCLYRSTQQDVLFAFKQLLLERDNTSEGQDVADCLTLMLLEGQLETAKAAIKDAFAKATGQSFVMPKRIHWDEKDNAVYEY